MGVFARGATGHPLTPTSSHHFFGALREAHSLTNAPPHKNPKRHASGFGVFLSSSFHRLSVGSHTIKHPLKKISQGEKRNAVKRPLTDFWGCYRVCESRLTMRMKSDGGGV